METPIKLSPIVYLSGLSELTTSKEDEFSQTIGKLGLELEKSCSKARDDWALLIFIDIPDLCLKRYFSYQLVLINESLTQLKEAISAEFRQSLEKMLIDQTEHLFRYFVKFVDVSLSVAPAYREFKQRSLTIMLDETICLIKVSRLKQQLADCILQYLSIEPLLLITYEQIVYYQLFIETINAALQRNVVDITFILTEQLTRINFNSLRFFAYYQKQFLDSMEEMALTEKLDFLQKRLSMLPLEKQNGIPVYDSAWPSLAQMLKVWIQEEIISIQQTIKQQDIQKLPLNLSVAQLACFLRIFNDEAIFGQSNLTELFKFIVSHYKTKRQSLISLGSLSKEFYSINQVTAAVTRDYLQKMIARINKSYFPVWAVVGVLLFFQ
jgi:hypothetical protein